MNKTWYHPTEAARLMGVSRDTVRRYGSDGRLRFQRTKGGHRRYEADSIVEFLARKAVEIENKLRSVRRAA